MTQTVWPLTPIGSSPRRSSQMPTGKRASMREGPLAALFRKTAEDTEPAHGATRAPETAHDVFARSDRMAESFSAPSPVGRPVLRVVGVGGAGVNAVNRMVEAEIAGVEFMAINTDLQSLQQSEAHETLHIGDRITRGLGSGSNPELGRLAAREEYDRIKAMLR